MEMKKIAGIQAPADLDSLLSEFNQWQKYSFDICCEKTLLSARLNLTNKLVADSEKKEGALREEMEGLKAQVNRLQGTLARRCDLEEKNNTLNKDNEELKRCMSEQKNLYENNLKTKENAHQTVIDSLQATMRDLKTAHEEELVQLQVSLREEAEAEKAELQQQMQRQCNEIENLKRLVEEVEQQKMAETSRLRFECDEKLLKIQKQTSRQPVPGAGRNQDIYRQKLQHVKAESEREIANLKRTITELQGELEMQQTKQRSTRPGPARPPPQKRARNY